MVEQREWLTPKVHESRVRLLQDRVGDLGLDGVLLRDLSDISYFAGVLGLSPLRPIWLMVPAAGAPALVLPRVEAPVAAAASWVSDQRQFVEWREKEAADNWSAPLGEVLGDRGLQDGRIGIQFGALTVAEYDVLRRSLPLATFVDCGLMIADLRRRKDQVELAIMRIAG